VGTHKYINRSGKHEVILGTAGGTFHTLLAGKWRAALTYLWLA